MDGIELEDRELIAAIRQKREPNARAGPSLHARHGQDRIHDRPQARMRRVNHLPLAGEVVKDCISQSFTGEGLLRRVWFALAHSGNDWQACYEAGRKNTLPW